MQLHLLPLWEDEENSSGLHSLQYCGYDGMSECKRGFLPLGTNPISFGKLLHSAEAERHTVFLLVSGLNDSNSHVAFSLPSSYFCAHFFIFPFFEETEFHLLEYIYIYI